MTTRTARIAVFLTAGLLAASLFARGRKPPPAAFAVEPTTVIAGRTAAVWLLTTDDLEAGTLAFGAARARFFQTKPGEWRALLGVASDETPGPKQALFTGTFAKDRVFHSTVSFVVEAGTYPVGHVRLTPEKLALMTTGKVEEDARVLDRVYREPRELEKLWSGRFIMPATGVVSSVYGARRKYGDGKFLSPHSGTDIANDVGTEIVAPARGRVVFCAWLDSFGNSVMLDHGHGVYSYYLHMKETSVKYGETVEPGIRLGLMGAEGLATGPHLHWSFVVSGVRVDPFEWTEREFP